MDVTHETDDPIDALRFVRQNRHEYRALRRVVLKPDRVKVFDINGDSLEVTGVGWSTTGITALLDGLGATHNPSTVNEPPPAGDEKTFDVVRNDPWGQDRIL